MDEEKQLQIPESHRGILKWKEKYFTSQKVLKFKKIMTNKDKEEILTINILMNKMMK